jgi:hypothetical protein
VIGGAQIGHGPLFPGLDLWLREDEAMGSLLAGLVRSRGQMVVFLCVSAILFYAATDFGYTVNWYNQMLADDARSGVDLAGGAYFLGDPFLFLLGAFVLCATMTWRTVGGQSPRSRENGIGGTWITSYVLNSDLAQRALFLAAATALVVVILHGYRDYQDALMRSPGDPTRLPLKGLIAAFDDCWGHWRESVVRVAVAAGGAFFAAILAVWPNRSSGGSKPPR